MMRFCLFALISAVCLGFGAIAGALPPDEDGAAQALADSSRHQEYVKLDVAGMDAPLNTFVVYPERADKAPIVIVIHEIFGMTDWANSVADAFAAEGFIALAPDMISGQEGNAMGLVRALTREQIVARLDAVRAYGLTLPAANGKVGCTGFCWGGSATFIYATAQPALDAGVVNYGSAPANEELAKIKAPLLGNFAEMDARVNTTIAPAKAHLDSLGKSFEYEMFTNAGHGFFRAQGGRDGSNLAATQKGWPKTVAFFREHLETDD